MTRTDRKLLERENRRNAIIDAAEQVIFNSDYESARMEEIAEKAGISKGSLYTYFNSKVELYLAINHRGLETLDRMFAKILTDTLSGREMVVKLMLTNIEFADQHPEYFDVLLYFMQRKEAIIGDIKDEKLLEETKELGSRMFTYIVRAIQLGIQDKSIDPSVEPYSIAIQTLATIRGMALFFIDVEGCQRKFGFPKNVDLKTSILQFVNTLEKGLRAS